MLGLPEVLVIIAVAIVAVLPASRICAKAGFPAWLGAAAVVPGLNVVLAFFLVFSTWPIEKRLQEAIPAREK